MPDENIPSLALADAQTPRETPESPGSPPPSAVASPAADGSGAGGGVVPPDLFARIERASAGAVEQHVADTAKRGRGRPKGSTGKMPARLPNGKFVPRAGVAPAPGAAPLDEIPTPLVSPDVPAPAPFDREAAGALVEIGVGLLNDMAGAIVRAVAMKETGDKALAEDAAKSVQMSEKISGAVKLGAVQCAEKYAVRMDYAPETLLFGGLIIWGGQVTLSIRSLKATGAELREKANDAKP